MATMRDAGGKLLDIGDKVKAIGSRSNTAQGEILDYGRFDGTWKVRFNDGSITSFDADKLVKIPKRRTKSDFKARRR